MRSPGDAHCSGRPPRAWLRAAFGLGCLSLALCTSACGVDDRALYEGLGPNGGNGSGGSSGTGSSAADGGDEGMVAPLPVCVYGAGTVADGCATLVQNPGFASNVASWVAEPVGMTEGWLAVDAKGDSKSGSIVITNLNYKTDAEAANGTNGGAARQCLPVNAGKVYELAADIFVPSGQGMGFDGDYTSDAELSLFFYDSADCTGQTASNYTSTQITQAGEWVHVEGSTPAPKESGSMAVRLSTQKPFRQVSFEARFDNVLVRERPAP